MWPGGDGACRLRDARSARPTRLAGWRGRSTPPGTGMVYFRDLIWPTAGRRGGRLIASVWYLGKIEGEDEVPRLPALVAPAQRRRDGDRGGRPPRAPRSPRTAARRRRKRTGFRTSPARPTAGSPRLLAPGLRASRWELRPGPAPHRSARRVFPAVGRDADRRVVGGRVATAPVFSIDNRWIYTILERGGRQATGSPGGISVPAARHDRGAIDSPRLRLVQNGSERHAR